MRILTPAVLGSLVTIVALAPMQNGGPPSAHAQYTAPPTDCSTPLGALPPAQAQWCIQRVEKDLPTFREGLNSWVDDWDHGLSDAGLGPGYKIFDKQWVDEHQPASPLVNWLLYGIHFRHQDHWMADVEGRGRYGGVFLRPDRAFRFQDGRLVVEFDAAAGIAEYRAADGNDVAFPELVVTTAPQPTGDSFADTLGTGMFRGHWTFGCQFLERYLTPHCQLATNENRAGSDVRKWVIHEDSGAGGTLYGGNPWNERAGAWRRCIGTDPDTNCRDRFRVTLSKTSVRIDVNGRRYMEVTDLPPASQFPDALLDADLYVYAASWVWRAGHFDGRQTVRFHWDRFAVNPEGADSAPAISVPIPDK